MNEQNQYSFWWFILKWCRLNYLKIVTLDTVKYLLYPVTQTQTLAIDTIAIDSFEDVCGFCLWLNTHCAQLPAARWAPLTVFLFPVDKLCCVVVISNCFDSNTLESDLTLTILIFSLPLTETLTYPRNTPGSHVAQSIDFVTAVHNLWTHLGLYLLPESWYH